jgi:hypothetical protein
MRMLASAGLCRLNQASLCVETEERRGNSVDHMREVGIIRKAALYAGHGPGTVDLFRRLWDMDALRVVHRAHQTGQQPSLLQ